MANLFTMMSPSFLDLINPEMIGNADTSSTGNNDDILTNITQKILERLNTPDENVTRLTQLLSDMPQREKPSLMRRIGAGITGVGYGPKAAQEFLDKPYNQKIEDWSKKVGLAKTIADEDIKNQRDELAAGARAVTNAINQQKADQLNQRALDQLQQKYDKAEQDRKLAEERLNANRDNQAAQLAYHNAVLAANDAKHAVDMAAREREYMRRDADRDAALKAANDRADSQGWTNMNIPDPSDPTKQIAVRTNARTGETYRVQLDDQDVGGFTKPGTGGANSGLTSQTRAMMEGAQMLRPHIDELRKQAIDLQRRGLFGPVMSRVRDLAAKIGTTGSPEEVQKSFEDFATILSTDPLLKQNTDTAVGQFLTGLGLMASGAGRVHGGARGGGSPQMINYMKGLLTSDSTLSMFNGRLNALDSYMKGYAAGPSANPKVKTKLDAAIEKILGGK